MARTGPENKREERTERRLRACLTEAEWRRFHVLAAEHGLSLQDLTSALILAALEGQSTESSCARSRRPYPLGGALQRPAHAPPVRAAGVGARSGALIRRGRRRSVATPGRSADSLRARREQVALPDRRVQARLSLDQGRPPVPARTPQRPSLHRALPSPVLRRARIRPPQERWALAPAPRPWAGPGRLHADLTILAKFGCTLAQAASCAPRGVSRARRNRIVPGTPGAGSLVRSWL